MAETHSDSPLTPKANPVSVCAECGEPLGGPAASGEELCRYCEEAQFQPRRIRLGERPNGRRPHIR